MRQSHSRSRRSTTQRAPGGAASSANLRAQLKNQLRTSWRSLCPLNASVEILGDRWSLLIVRDMMLRGFRSYKQFLDSYERIATNILADRLRRLEENGIIVAEKDPSDGRKVAYFLTAKGMDLAPVLTEMVLWAASHEDVENQALVREIQKDKAKFLSTIRDRWLAARPGAS